MQVFSDVKRLFLFSDMAVKTAKSENKKTSQRQGLEGSD